MTDEEIYQKNRQIELYAKEVAQKLLNERGNKRGGYIVMTHESGFETISQILSKKKCYCGPNTTSWDDMISWRLKIHAFCHDYKDVQIKWIKTLEEYDPPLGDACFSSRFSPEVRKVLDKIEGKQ